MTTLNSTDYDRALLLACKNYIRITEATEEAFINELMDLASQYVNHLPAEILDQCRQSDS
jgi:hypothetical protein